MHAPHDEDRSKGQDYYDHESDQCPCVSFLLDPRSLREECGIRIVSPHGSEEAVYLSVAVDRDIKCCGVLGKARHGKDLTRKYYKISRTC